MYMIFLLTQIWLVTKIFHEILTRPTLDGVTIISKIVTASELTVIEIAGGAIGIREITVTDLRNVIGEILVFCIHYFHYNLNFLSGTEIKRSLMACFI